MRMAVNVAQFSQVVALIHEAGAAPERWSQALAGVVALVQATRASVMDIDAASNALLGLDHVGHDPANAKVYADYYYAIDPTRALAVSTPALKAITTFESFPLQVRARHEYFDFARRIDIGDVIGASTPATSGQRSLLAVQRSVNASGFGAEEKQIFELIAGHVALAKRVQRALGEAWAATAQLEAALGKLAAAALIVDGDARVRHLNPAAIELMSRYPNIAFRSGKLLFTDAKLNAAVHSALRSAAGPVARSAALRLPLGKETGEILIAPLAPTHAGLSTWQVPLALLVVAIPAQDEKSIAWRMRQLYRLTPAESQVAALLALGASVEEITKAKRISDATLRSHLRSIFSKTGTRRQAELVHLALRGAALKHDG
jgi:DNA-binding CsgD family transcriptional regulator